MVLLHTLLTVLLLICLEVRSYIYNTYCNKLAELNNLHVHSYSNTKK